ncbi:hypothetical protein [Myxosarcina sp. GI1]|uniref:competence protein CoiA family protein n=1 Tax=Myxosarcina sp. GI1 TaxID=1541065 RepID=UPI00056A31DB|nr:hypothetical protein [Myxosarcina sp. GI1]
MNEIKSPVKLIENQKVSNLYLRSTPNSLREAKNRPKLYKKRSQFAAYEMKVCGFKISSSRFSFTLNIIPETHSISPRLNPYSQEKPVILWLKEYLKELTIDANLYFLSVKHNDRDCIFLLDGNKPKIVYKYQTEPISLESLDTETAHFAKQKITCFWIFDCQAKNKITEKWATARFGEFRFVQRYDDYMTILSLLPNNSIGFPLNFIEEGRLIRKYL